MALINVDSINVDENNQGRQAQAMTNHLSSAEAAARLGVKRETLYAYVSRGLLDRTLSLDGRSSLFDAAQVDELRRNRRRSAKGELRTVITTSITELDEQGHRYRGVPISDLAGQSFEDVADLIWQHSGSWDMAPELFAAVHAVREALPATTPVIDRHRVAVAVASALDPLRASPAPTAHAQAGRAMIVAAAAAMSSSPAPEAGVAAQIVHGLCEAEDQPSPSHAETAGRRSVDLALILLADHGLAASTFSARIAASVRGDPYSVVAAGLGPVGGQLHGAASVGVHRLFTEAERVGVDATVGALLASGERFSGVGHTIYQTVDPREVLLTEALQQTWADDPRLALVSQIRRQLDEHLGLVINIDFALGAMTWLMRAPEWAGEALFAIARIVGWVAHGMEEFHERPVRFRPAARFVPPPAPGTLATPGVRSSTLTGAEGSEATGEV